MNFPVTKTSEAIRFHLFPDLPARAIEEEFIHTVLHHQFVVAEGETGSGKSTLFPFYLLKAGVGCFGKIGMTEPRRIIPYSLVPYMSDFVDSEKRIVAGHVRFWNTITKDSQLVIMTVGELIQDLLFDPELREYSVIIVDEAHERSTDIDYILGQLKIIAKSRPELRIIIVSATIDTKKFSDFFGGESVCPIITVPGRVYPVEIIYSDVPHFEQFLNKKEYYARREKSNPPNVPFEVAQKIVEIHQRNESDFLENSGILAKLPGRDEIASCIEHLEFAELKDVVILPAYGHMDLNEQAAVFLNYPGKRKIVIGTNILETSVTIPEMKYGVDCGLIKQMDFFPGSGRSSLQTRPHSKSGDDQFAGRLGRTQGGICHRLYTKEEYEALPLFTKPEICRTNLDAVILHMIYLGIQDVEHFPFIDLPSHKMFAAAYESLKRMGAMDKNEVLTDHGKMMAKLPLEPVLSHMLLNSVKYGCVNEIATIVSAISSGHIMLRPPEEQEQAKADKAHERFESEVSDALTFLNIWDEYVQHEGDTEWCLENYMNEKGLIEMRDIRKQLLELLAEFKISISSTYNPEKVLKAVALGLVENLFKAKEEKREGKDDRRKERQGKGNRRNGGSNTYYPVLPGRVNDPVFIHPGSSTFGFKPPMLVALEVVRTTKEYMRMCSMVDPKWLPHLLPDKFSEVPNDENGKKSEADKKKRKRSKRRGNAKKQKNQTK
ncbi:MAG: oligonucleotide/oligosaccharide-binding fold domain-containing protein [Candidatus Paceibacterota bacterium]|jgi:HrpA-like RNA helicase|nr:DEAD/DEAH box helicase [Candidatus Paceibacterota bacterium]